MQSPCQAPAAGPKKKELRFMVPNSHACSPNERHARMALAAKRPFAMRDCSVGVPRILCRQALMKAIRSVIGSAMSLLSSADLRTVHSGVGLDYVHTHRRADLVYALRTSA